MNFNERRPAVDLHSTDEAANEPIEAERKLFRCPDSVGILGHDVFASRLLGSSPPPALLSFASHLHIEG